MDLRTAIQTYPNTIHISATALCSLFGLTMTPTFVPLVFTLAMLLLYAPVLFHRPDPVVYTALLWFSISLCSSFGRLVPALNALSTAGTSIIVLLAMSAVASAIAISAIFLDVRISTRTSATQAVLFPAIWTTLWVATSHLPLNMGRLTSWSPMSGIQAYQWMTPWTGPAGIDWVTAAWAVVVSQSIGIWYMGGMEEDEIPTTGTSGKRSKSAGTWALALILTALTIPSFIFSGYPLPVVTSETVTNINVGCVLPQKPSPTLDDYIKDSKQLSSGPGHKLLLWPEGAVSWIFQDESERDVQFNYIRQNFSKSDSHSYWAVSFEEKIIDPSGIAIRRKGVALLSSSTDEEVPIYYKRFLVPIAESFALTPGSSPPPTITLELHEPTHQKPKWGPRSIDVTASICLDFAMPSPFRDLDSKPSLILAPADTWDPAIGNRMWEEVKQRANEIGSVALWCDGGKGGVSGVAGGGYNEIYQAGAGSWAKAVGIPHPFDSTRTFYASFGEAPVFAASWFFVTGFWLTPGFLPLARRLHAVAMNCYDWAMRLVGKRNSQQQNLIDI
ncbi:hypothetical protein B0H19DRAFT_1128312 [Mycena capillaripes]|nr:hypothetical protein B0H19DRAFT_1128312 [Mycena capillaripes]